MWKCSKCGEHVEDSFDVCWNCGTSSAGVEDPQFTKVEEVRTEQRHESVEVDGATAADSDLVITPAPAAPPPDRLAEFQRTLVELTPRVYVTPALIAVNVLVFVLMAVTGVSLISPTIEDLLNWGADFGPKTTSGEWWRLLTCTFVHIGIVHLLFNMWVLAAAGPLVERMIGNVGFLLLYLLSGLCGSLASLLWNPLLVSAGASGAIFGIYGALLGLLLRHTGSIPPQALVKLRNSGLAFLFYNLIFGMMVANIDYAAHIGGLAGGFLGGIALSQAFTPAARPGRPVRNLRLCGLGAFLVIAGTIGIYGRHAELANVAIELEGFEAVERKALQTYNAAVAKAQRQQLTDAAFADVLDRDVLPQWRAARQRLSALKNIPQVFQGHVALLLDYMRLRQEAWELYAEALRENNLRKAQQANHKQQLAEAAARRIIDKNRK